MNYKRNSRRLLPLLLTIILSSCGGQGAGLNGNGPAVNESDVRVDSSELFAPRTSSVDLETRTWVNGKLELNRSGDLRQDDSSLPGELQGVGRIPRGEAELLGQGQKITNAIEQLDPTMVYDDSGDITINVDSIELSPGPGMLSWAMYQLNLPDSGYPADLRMQINSFSGTGGFYIFVSNYTTGRWLMSEMFNSPGQKTFSLPTSVESVPQNYLSPMNNLYVAILAYDGVTVGMNGFSQDTNTRPQALIVETNNTYVRSTTEEFQFRNEAEDSDNGIASQSWDYDMDDIEDASASVVNHTYDNPGVHAVKLTVWDHNGGWDTDVMYVYTYDTDDNALPDEFMEALNETDPDPVPPPDIPLPELGFDETFEWFFDTGGNEWWEVPGSNDNVSWKTFGEQDGSANPYSDMRSFLPMFGSYYYDDHTDILPFSNSLGQTVGNWSSMQGIVQTGAWLHGVGVANEGIIFDLDEEDPLAFAIKTLMNEYPSAEDATFAQIQAEVSSVPLDFQIAMGRLVNAIRQAGPYHEAYLDGNNTLIFGDTVLAPPAGENWPQIFFDNAHGMVLSHENGGPTIAYATNGTNPANFNYEDLFQGAAVLANAIDDFHAFLDGWTPGASFDFDIRTSIGNIRVTGDGDDNIVLPDWEATEDGFYMLQVDIGGNDDYFCHAGGNAALNNPFAICIDKGGNDNYHALDDPNDVDRSLVPSNDNSAQQGSGRMGYGILLDLEGDDEYASVRMSQGCSIFGVGILRDVSGIDVYAGEALCQGASLVGIGALLDDDGLDNYSSVAYSQGFGSFRGIGIISNHGTDSDNYSAEPSFNMDMPEYNSGDNTTNNSFCQGAALGKQPSGDATVDPFIGSGGLGLLVDEGGDDAYSAGNFAQACGFMEGTGMLLEMAGNDDYSGVTSNGSFSARRAAAMLWDYSGDDEYRYTGERNMAAGSLYSVAWLMDNDGLDVYEADMASIGAAQLNSFCYFVDFAGGDEYSIFSAPVRSSLGSAYIGEFDPGGFDATPTLALFVDILGADNYLMPEAMLDRDGATLTVADDSIWVRAKHDELEPHWHDYEYGVGADGAWMP